MLKCAPYNLVFVVEVRKGRILGLFRFKFFLKCLTCENLVNFVSEHNEIEYAPIWYLLLNFENGEYWVLHISDRAKLWRSIIELYVLLKY